MCVKQRGVFFSCLLLMFVGCTTGQLEYVTPEGTTKVACNTEYTWQPSVDKYAVEYILSYCAETAAKQGFIVKNISLLSIDRSFPKAPKGCIWTHELAKQFHVTGLLTDKQYGYIIAALDLGHITGKSECREPLIKSNID